MPTLPARMDVEAPASVADSGAPHRYSYAVVRSTSGDPIFQCWKGPTSDPNNLVFEITQEGNLSRVNEIEGVDISTLPTLPDRSHAIIASQVFS